MDGPVFRIGRLLAIDFQTDRNSKDQLELAYRRIETVDSVVDSSENRLQGCLRDLVVTPQLVSEIHG
jgi:hypothetical protein